LGFQNRFDLDLSGEPLLICDPIYIADVFNDSDGPAAFLKAHGVFLADLGGNVSGPVQWRSSSLVLGSVGGEDETFRDGIVAHDVISDSGCVMFLPLGGDLPEELRAKIEDALRDETAVIVEVPSGHWSFFYEQHEGSPPELFRNIVARPNDPT
jgi:hypothetical protein